MENIKTVLRKFPPNATDLFQPADSFVIQKLKDSWRDKWDLYKYMCVAEGDWHSTNEDHGSGRLINPGKKFFLKLAADVVRDVNNQRNSVGVSYARRAMIRTGLSLNLQGVWTEDQLTDPLQAIIAKYRVHFEGQPISAADVETESEDE